MFKIKRVAAIVALVASQGVASASVTCGQFRQSLAQAIADGGDRVAQPMLDDIAYKRDDATMTRFALKGIVGLDGNLRCVVGDRIEAFDAAVDIEEKGEGALRIHRLTALAAAAACAVTPKMAPNRCEALARQVADQAVKKYAKAFVRGEQGPIEFAKAKLASGFELEFDAASGNLSFILVPPIGE